MHLALCVSHLPFLFNCTYDVLILLDLRDVRKNCIGRKQKHGHVSELYTVYLAREEFSRFSIYDKENLPQKF
jgi:hypothetical protein